MRSVQPISGQWYMRLTTGQRFEVVSVNDETIEIQDYDGALDEFEVDAWPTDDLEVTDPPEDLAGVYDMATPDEADGGEAVELDGNSPLQRAEQESWQRSIFETDDNWGTAAIDENPPREEQVKEADRQSHPK